MCRKSFRTFLLATLLLLDGRSGFARGLEQAAKDADSARRFFQAGDFTKSLDLWRGALKSYQRKGTEAELIQAELGLASVYQALGQTKLAIESLEKAREVATASVPSQMAAIQAELGAVQMLSAASGDAEANLKSAFSAAEQQGNFALAASVGQNLGVLSAYQREFPEAKKYYELAISRARKAGQESLAVKAEANYAGALLKENDFNHALDRAQAAETAARKLPNTHEKACALINVASTFTEVFVRDPRHDNTLRLRAFEALKEAAMIAEPLGDRMALSYALGYEGHLYEQEKKVDSALQLTRKALFLTQQIQSPDALFRWEWQVGRLLHAQKKDAQAIAAYRRAVTTLEGIRHDMSMHYGNPVAGSSFREVAGSLYFELADLLLQQADGEKDAHQVENLLVEARNQTEQLKSAELEDYFQDSCVNLLKSKVTKVEAIAPSAAVVYIISLPDRTELLVGLQSGLQRVKVPVTSAELTESAHRFRADLEDRTSNLYLEQSCKLYDWLIKPLEPLLSQNHIETLVFVPDGALRNIPMAALSDGSKFLVEKYAIAVTPGLTLMEPHAIQRNKIHLIVNGLSEGVQGFEPLTYVPEEVEKLQELYGGKKLMNKDFVLRNVQEEFTNGQFSVVHIASHGHFDRDSKKTFLLTFDSKLTLNQLERLLRPSQLKDAPVELLTLSACQTAAGDDRAALGLAGVAIKAGARCAFATLWFVNDQASSSLVADFYSELRDSPTLSKAAALQKAQIKLLSDARYSHPCYWAPYLIIGNWL